MDTVIKQVLGKYDISYAQIHMPQKGYRNSSYPVELADGQFINLVLYKHEPYIAERIQRIHAATSVLTHLPVRRPIDSRIITLRSGSMVRYGALYNYLPGQTIPWEAYTKNHIKLVGMAMGTLHAALRNGDSPAPVVTDEYLHINDRMRQYFAQSGVVNAMSQKLQLEVDQTLFAHFAQILKLAHNVPGQQLLHMDFVRGNLLFAPATSSDVFVIDDLALSGIIDFEKVAYGHPAFDVARTLAFLLVDCKHKSADKIVKYFLQSGYNKRGASTFVNVFIRSHDQSYDLLYELTNLFLFYDFYKFLRHNPYESLADNEHFVRTVDILVARKMLESTVKK